MSNKLNKVFSAFMISLMIVICASFVGFAVDETEAECSHLNTSPFTEETDSTCSEHGHTSGVYCNDCETLIIMPEEKPLAEHTVVVDKGIPATCITDGKTEGSHCSVCSTPIVAQEVIPANSEHDFVTTETPATCVTGGFVMNQCTRCGRTEIIETSDALGHDMPEAWVVTKAATCTEAGVEERTCGNCGKVEEREIVATGHQPVIDAKVPATCTKSGLTEGSHCSVCNAVITEQKVIEALGHKYTNYVPNGNATCTADGTKTAVCDICAGAQDTVVDGGSALGHAMPEKWETVKAATCTEAGSETRACEREKCAYTETRTVAKIPHTIVEDAEIPATCTETGLTAGSHCSSCGEVIANQEVIEALGHSMPETWTKLKEPTCTETGREEKHCARCDYFVSQEIEMIPHSFKYKSNGNANCTADGTMTAVCDNCGFVSASDTIVEKGSALGHSMPEAWETVKAATCTEEGSETRKCERCDYTETRVTEIIPHEFTNYVSNNNATCTGNATETAICNICKVESDQRMAPGTALGHMMPVEWTTTKKPTCTEKGIEEKHCTRCDCDYFESQEIDMLPHSFTNYVSNNDATCIKDGTKTAICNTCGEAKDTVTDTGSVLGHDLPETWTTTKESTYTENGVEEKHCTRCDYFETQEIPMLPHSFTNYVSNNDATCLADGTKTAVCDTCGEAKDTVKNEGSALGHDLPDEWTTTRETSCTEAGLQEKHCSRCDYFETQEIPMLAHKFTNYVSDKNETCLADGTKTAICDTCGEAKDTMTNEDSMLEHTVVVDEAFDPTCTAAGKTEGQHCSVCGTVLVAQDEKAATGHDYDSWVYDKASTCEENGLKHRICKTCGEQADEVIPAVGHIMPETWTVIKESTCTETGIEERICQRCKKTEQREVAMAAHTVVVDTAIAATCTQNGLTEGSHCGVCDTVIAAQEITAPLGHRYITEVEEATCTENGEEKKICERCSDTIIVELEAQGHKPTELKAVAATCTKAGKTAGSKCSVCGKILVKQETVKATGHKWGAWKTTKKAT
ncbi:MAG: hypothetical protein NC110_05965, partial [Ruminococcus sp.]|nr:hypothetical protein [Ruminococcus sp.]